MYVSECTKKKRIKKEEIIWTKKNSESKRIHKYLENTWSFVRRRDRLYI